MNKMYDLIADEMLTINPMFFNKETLSNIIRDTLDSSYDELAYGFITNSLMMLLECNAVEEFIDLLEKVQKKFSDDNSTKSLKSTLPNDHFGVFKARVNEILNKMTRVCNKLRFDKMIVRQILKESGKID